MQVGFAMADIRACNGSLPKSEGEFFSGEVAPTFWDISFVFDFVEDDRFPIGVAIKDGARGVLDRGAVLDAGVCNPGTGVIEQLFAVVNGEEVMIRVGGGNNLAKAFEIFLALFFHEIVFVGKRPPHIAIGSEPADY